MGREGSRELFDIAWKEVMESVQVRSFSWSVFSRIRTEYGEIRSMCFEGLEGVISQESHAYWRQVWNKFLKF